MLVAVQLSVAGLYLPPVLRIVPLLSYPPHTIMSAVVHTAVFQTRAVGALLVLVALQVSSVQVGVCVGDGVAIGVEVSVGVGV